MLKSIYCIQPQGNRYSNLAPTKSERFHPMSNLPMPHDLRGQESRTDEVTYSTYLADCKKPLQISSQFSGFCGNGRSPHMGVVRLCCLLRHTGLGDWILDIGNAVPSPVLLQGSLVQALCERRTAPGNCMPWRASDAVGLTQWDIFGGITPYICSSGTRLPRHTDLAGWQTRRAKAAPDIRNPRPLAPAVCMVMHKANGCRRH